ncbi:hypothetical protein PLICRDRAFT_115102, partial [Plicaturopsis crispa FD-325 SS-3]
DEWWPWPNKQEALLDIMGAFPRALFSESELKATTWYAKKLGMPNVPSATQVKNHREAVHAITGITTHTVDGKLGNTFAFNDWKEILAHEWANPLVRKHIKTYAEDIDDSFDGAYHGEKWRHLVDGNLAGPMARAIDGKDYFVEEPAMANINELADVGPVMPVRWFKRNGQIWAQAHHLRLRPTGDAYVIDARKEGYIELPLTAFFLSITELEDAACQQRYNLPPQVIAGTVRIILYEWFKAYSYVFIGILTSEIEPLVPWNRPVRNRWRAIAKGRRIHVVPLWFYCDDTSGNTSKKWNKHNSILFTLAGLPREHSQLLYNVHFISTSNLSSPLEMMEPIVESLEEASDEGLEVWDCDSNEEVLLLPWALAFQGDNPMQSEFASHIGMQGKCYCRVCHAKGTDKDRAPGRAGEISRIDDFTKVSALCLGCSFCLSVLQAGPPRNKDETIESLEAQLKRAFDGAPSAVDTLATDSGAKDKYFQHYVDKLQNICNEVRDRQKHVPPRPGLSKAEELREHLAEVRAALPDNLFNPVLRLRDFDPHRDTPVEILHVILLGIVKYWWRDAVSRSTTAQKELLKTRLSDVNIAGLEISRPRGHTLVHYAGSLVGRDFRVILQVAPAVLHGIIPDVHYEAWLALCRLTPLVFQPVITNLPAYLEKLESRIRDFLAATALWTTQWFNKPKFHLLSYNFVIRLRSILSNRRAPSTDIAHSFNHLHAVRHLVSGGFVVISDDHCASLGMPRRRQAGPGVRALLEDDQFLDFMCMSGVMQNSSKTGHFVPMPRMPACAWSDTIAFRSGTRLTNTAYVDVLRCRLLVLRNGDRIAPSNFVLCRQAGTNSDSARPIIGRVEEILVDAQHRRLIGVTVQVFQLSAEGPVLPYRFPSIIPETFRMLLAFDDILCGINTFHNCHKHHCVISPTRQVVQERQQRLDRFENEIRHLGQPDDLLLNLAQLRNADLVQLFQPLLPPAHLRLPRVELLEQAVLHREALDSQAASALLQKPKRAAAPKAKKSRTGNVANSQRGSGNVGQGT